MDEFEFLLAEFPALTGLSFDPLADPMRNCCGIGVEWREGNETFRHCQLIRREVWDQGHQPTLVKLIVRRARAERAKERARAEALDRDPMVPPCGYVLLAVEE